MKTVGLKIETNKPKQVTKPKETEKATEAKQGKEPTKVE